MTVHWWMHWFWITAVVAALLLVPLASALPAGSAASHSTPPSAAGGRPAHTGPRGWGSWPPPYEDEDDDEDGFLGPRALPLEGRPAEEEEELRALAAGDHSPGDGVPLPEELVPQDGDVDSEILAEYAREVAANRTAAGNTNVPEEKNTAYKTLTTRDVQNIAIPPSNTTVVDGVSSQLNNSGSHGNYSSDSATAGTRESKSFSSSVVPTAVPAVKPLKHETGHSAVDTEGKMGTSGDGVAVSAAPVASSGSSTATPREVESSDKLEEQKSSAKAVAQSTGAPIAPEAGGAAAAAGSSSPQPADVYATAPAEEVSETGPDVSSSPPEESAWTAYDASAAADDDVDVVGQQEEAVPLPDLRSRTAEREAAEEEELVPEEEAPVSRGRVAPAAPSAAAMDAASITGIALGIVVFSSLVGAISFVMYRRRYLNKPQTLNDKCSNPDSSGYIDDSTLRENSEEMYSLDNDSFLNSLEAMTIQNYWTDSVKHTKL